MARASSARPASSATRSAVHRSDGREVSLDRGTGDPRPRLVAPRRVARETGQRADGAGEQVLRLVRVTELAVQVRRGDGDLRLLAAEADGALEGGQRRQCRRASPGRRRGRATPRGGRRGRQPWPARSARGSQVAPFGGGDPGQELVRGERRVGGDGRRGVGGRVVPSARVGGVDSSLVRLGGGLRPQRGAGRDDDGDEERRRERGSRRYRPVGRRVRHRSRPGAGCRGGRSGRRTRRGSRAGG